MADLDTLVTMSTGSSQRLVGVIILTTSLLLVGCQAGQTAATSQGYNPVDGRNVNVPEGASFDDSYIAVRNALIVVNEDAAAVVATLVNNSEDADVLESVTIDGLEAMLSGGPIDFAAHQSISLGFAENASATASGFEGEVGQWTDLTLRFTKAGNAEISVLAAAPGASYATPSTSPSGKRLTE